MTKKQILKRLQDIANIEHHSCGIPGPLFVPWVSADLIDQEQLYKVQASLITLIEDLDRETKK